MIYRRFSSLITQAICVCIGFILIFPIIYAVLGAFKSPAEFAAYPPRLLPESFKYIKNFRLVFERAPMLRYLLNSLITACVGGGVKLILASLAAYGFAFYDFRFKKPLFMLILGAMMLPTDTLTVTNYRTISALGLTDTYLGICIVSFVGASQMLLLRHQFKLMPKELREAAQTDGCGDIKYLIQVVLPVNAGVLLTLFLQGFIAQWNSYLWPLLVTTRDEMRTVQVGISMLTDAELSNYETVLAGACVALMPSIILFFLSRHKFTGSVSAGAVTE